VEPEIRIGIDIGGTFTDFVFIHPASGTVETFKLLSTPYNPAVAVINGLAIIEKRIGGDLPIHIIHGSTVATNALLERKGARTALITTDGFRDVIEIGRQNRPELYNLFSSPLLPLVPEEYRFEVIERVGKQGETITPLDPRSVNTALATLEAFHPEAVAVCLLFAFTNPTHEQMIASGLRNAGYSVSVSSEILPEYREFERASTTVVNAYVSPVLQKYFSTLEKSIGQEIPGKKQDINLRVMQSNGGVIRIDEARQQGVRCILSGPAGGVIGAQYIAHQALSASEENHPSGRRVQMLTFDMGGTSTDVSLIDAEPRVTTEAIVGGYPIRIPVLDIHTIGAGGGSIATVDIGGVMRVGPESAGADPGPACYGKGTLPTVTDANLVLGRLQGEHFLGGQMPIDLERAKIALQALGEKLGLSTLSRPETAALGVIEIVNAHMERALRVISVERGHDPQDYTLLSFGGAGGLHAADLARCLKMHRVLIPPLASTLSAFGMLAADVIRDYTQTVMLPGDVATGELLSIIAPLISKGVSDVQAEGITPQSITIEQMLDMRYRGQSYELTIPFTDRYMQSFHEAHHRAYGTSRQGADVEIVNTRVRVVGKVHSPAITIHPTGTPDPAAAWLETRQVWFPTGAENVPLYRGESLLPGNRITGPAVVVRQDTTILIGIHDQAYVDNLCNLLIEVNNE
jgi:N-methylhydantoinase A